jgi:hypothetical protein
VTIARARSSGSRGTGDDTTRPHVLAVMRDEIKTVRCRFDRGAFIEDKTKFPGDVLRLAGGVLTAGYNWDTATKDVDDRTKRWIQQHL